MKIIFIGLLVISACSSIGKRVLDSSSPRRPEWIDSSELTWRDDGKVFFKGNYVVRGNVRANACIDLAKLNVKENLITEIQEEIKGVLDTAQDSIREDAEIVFSKSQTSKYRGQIRGLRFTRRYWEKYASRDNKVKISCHVLGQINKKQYLKTKRNIVNKITNANKELKEAVIKKQIDFFKQNEE